MRHREAIRNHAVYVGVQSHPDVTCLSVSNSNSRGGWGLK